MSRSRGDLFDAHVLADIEFVVIGDAPVIFEGLRRARACRSARHGNVPDFSSSGVVKNTMLFG